MANIKVCDRCGKKLDVERSVFNLTPNCCVLNVALFKRARYATSLPDIVRTEHDLCIECTTKLAEWMEVNDEQTQTS